MAYEMSIRLTDVEYAALEEAAKSGKRPETVLREIMLQKLQPPQPTTRPLTERELAEQLYREGMLLNLATRKPLTLEEQAERQRLAQVFAHGKPLSEMVIEDRVPYSWPPTF